jgi:hypothetical protein
MLALTLLMVFRCSPQFFLIYAFIINDRHRDHRKLSSLLRNRRESSLMRPVPARAPMARAEHFRFVPLIDNHQPRLGKMAQIVQQRVVPITICGVWFYHHVFRRINSAVRFFLSRTGSKRDPRRLVPAIGGPE